MGPQTNELERLLRQATNALLAAPITAVAAISAMLRRSTLSRVSLAVALAVILGIGFLSANGPAATVATRTTPIVPLTQAAFTTTFSIDRGLSDPVTLAFTTRMDPASVAAALKVEPTTPVELAWDGAGQILTVTPRAHWSVAAFNTVTVQAGALATSGQPLARPARAVFLTRDATTGSIVPTVKMGDRVSLDTAFVVSFDRPVDLETIETAIRLDPPTPGAVRSVTRPDGPTRFEFTPTTALQADVAYRLIVSGAHDTDGLALAPLSLAIRTVKAPTVVRFRPIDGSTGAATDAALSVRFTQAMDRRATGRAFLVMAGGKAVAGSVRWAESDTVLVFTPRSALPYGAKVSMDVGAGARNRAGITLGAPSHAVFQTARKGIAPTFTTQVAGGGSTGGGPTGGGGAVGGGSWGAVETYYLRLMNCTRTGGWVTSSGACSSPGGRSVAPLKLDSGISSKVSRPYAKRLAVGNACTHFIGGTPGDRLRRAGYRNYTWAENIGCRSGNPMAAVLGSHLFYQSERSYSGGHYVNLMNAKYDRVGIGVWVASGRVRLVIDFYHP
ncbi:MAG: Ig-like domain-containing protein [Chloroflexota bacterium]